jgi:hypothetical protein
MPSQSPLAGSRQAGADLLVGGLGFVTSLATAVVLWWVERQFGIAFYSWTFWFVVPAGAVLAGLAGASGYYAGARLFHQRPTKILLLNVLLASIATFLFIHYLSFATLDIEGVPVSEVLPFWQYLDIVTRSMSMQLLRAPTAGGTSELGTFGYVVALLQVLGFATGGFLVYVFLTELPYCSNCSRYLAPKGSRVHYSHDPDAVSAAAVTILEDVQAGALAHAIELHRTVGSPTWQKQDHLCSTIDVRRCKRCGQHWMKFSVRRRSGDDWKEIPELTASGFTQEAIGV